MEKNQASSSREYILRINKNSDVNYQLLKFNKNIEVEKWSSRIKLKKEVKGDRKTPVIDNMPKFGAGSEFGHGARLKAKKRRYESSKNVSETTSWNLDIEGKKFKGARQGGIAENSSYYLFSRGENNVINAHKLGEWYNFQPVSRYKTLTNSEAEKEFERRNSIFNKFNVMIQKKLSNKEDEEIDEYNENKEKGAKKTKEFKISEMDEWDESHEDSSNSTDDEKDKKKIKQKQKIKVKPKPKKKWKGSDESANEDSDNGDEEGRELDYISDSSEDVSDADAKVTEEMKGVSEEKALKSLLASDEDTNDEDEENKATDKNLENDSDSDNLDMDCVPINIMPVNFYGKKTNSGNPISIPNYSSVRSLESLQKNAKADISPTGISPTAHGITVEAVRRYLLRKPFTSAQLVNKFKNRSNLSSKELVTVIGSILKKINPEKQIIKDKMYLILKE